MAYLTEIATKTQTIPTFPIEVCVQTGDITYFRVSNVRNSLTYYLGHKGELTRQASKAKLFTHKPSINEILLMEEFSCETIGDFSSCDILDPNNWYIDKGENGYIISYQTGEMVNCLYLNWQGNLGEEITEFSHTPSLTEIFNLMKLYYETESINTYTVEHVVISVTKIESLHERLPKTPKLGEFIPNCPRYGI